jgi:hypothetical protein
LASALLLVLVLVLSSIWSVYSLKSELSEKQELLSMINSANDELHRLRESNAGAPMGAAAGGGNWQSYFETVAGSAGIDKGSLSVGSEKPGSSSDTTKETLYDLSVKHVNIKQVVRYAHGLETGSRPVKLRNLMIDTKSDPEGYLDATLSVSAFAMMNK